MSLQEARVQELFAQANAVIDGDHFVYTSGQHGSAYVNKDNLLKDPEISWWLMKILADWVRQEYADSIDIVIGPVQAGSIVAHDLAERLNKASSIAEQYVAGSPRRQGRPLSVYADKDGDDFVIKRGFDKDIPGKDVLIAEDILTTGSTVQKVIRRVRELDGRVLGVVALCNRGDVTAEALEVQKLFSLMDVSMAKYDRAACPLCRDHVPINTVLGHGRAYVAEHGQP